MARWALEFLVTFIDSGDKSLWFSHRAVDGPGAIWNQAGSNSVYGPFRHSSELILQESTFPPDVGFVQGIYLD